MPRTWKLGVARIYGLDQAFLNKTQHVMKSINTPHCVRNVRVKYS